MSNDGVIDFLQAEMTIDPIPTRFLIRVLAGKIDAREYEGAQIIANAVQPELLHEVRESLDVLQDVIGKAIQNHGNDGD